VDCAGEATPLTILRSGGMLSMYLRRERGYYYG
jgi:hypothetical protein